MQSARLCYEALTAHHADELFAPLSDPKLYLYQPGEPPQSRDGLHQRFLKLEQAAQERKMPDPGNELWLNWVIRLQSKNKQRRAQAAGMLQATVRAQANTKPGAGGAYLYSAYCAYIVFIAQQQRGYAEEAMRWMLAHLQSHYHVTLATADVDTRNTGSNKLLLKLGFHCTGTTKNADFFKGQSSDENHYRLELSALTNE